MSYSICAIGNSHTAAIKQAWQRRAPAVADGVTLTFFAARMQELGALTGKDGVLFPKTEELAEKLRYTSGGLERIVLAEYDAFVLIGLGYKFNPALVAGDYGIAEHETFGPAKRIVSRACFSAIAASAFAGSAAAEFLRNIRATSKAPVLLCPTPYRTEADFEAERESGDPRRANPAFWAALMETFEGAVSAYAARYQSEVVWQDENTCALPGFTKTEFTVGALMLSGGPRPSKDLHMNEDYGFHVLTAVLNRLDKISGGRVLPSARKMMRGG